MSHYERACLEIADIGTRLSMIPKCALNMEMLISEMQLMIDEAYTAIDKTNRGVEPITKKEINSAKKTPKERER